MLHYSSDFTQRLLCEAGLREGMRVLDIGCGMGDVSFLAASLVGRTGAVIGVDINENVLALARQRAKETGDPAPTFVKGDLNDLPGDLGVFDAIVGRRVLMYQPDSVEAVRVLMKRLVPDGLIALQELDMTMVPASIVPMPLHERAAAWLRHMLVTEGADVQMGFHLHGVLTQAGLRVEGVRAEAVVQTPDQPNNLGAMIKGGLSRIVDSGAVSAAEIDVETFQDRLNAERLETNATYISDMMFGAWARKPADHW
ncbi:MAG: methyltransferase domain-containing protein [Sphingobium limneticum]